MITKRDVVLAAIVAGVVLVAGSVIEHVRDLDRDAELLRVHGAVSRDSSARVAAVAKTDTVIARSDTTVKQSARADSGWTVARRAADRVASIVASTKPDTVKIRELVAIVDTLRPAGDTLARAAAADTMAIAQMRVAFAGERNAWATERHDLAHALEVSEARHRHWGLGVTIGPTVLRDPAGIVRAGPIGATIGLTYRW